VKACDAHFHVFGPPERYPYAPDLRYEPPSAPLEDYLEHALELGIGRYVFVQPSAYGRDNRCMLDAMRVCGPERCRGIVDVDEGVPAAELERLHALGVRGVRINVNPIKPPEPGFSSSLLERVHTLDAKCAGLGWMLDFLTPGWLTRELIPVFRELRSRFSVAHLGMFPALAGPQQPGFTEFVDFARGCERCWVKLTGAYRLSDAQPHYPDVAPFARALVAARPDRIVWGTDWPHAAFRGRMPNTTDLADLLGEWIPDEATRKRILVDNAATLYGF